jgi:hypothetical protein
MTTPNPAEPLLKDPPEFSLVLGGPLYQLYRRTRLAAAPLDLLRRRIIVITAIAWLPLLLFSAIDGRLMGVGDSFLHDIETHVRFLIALPVLIAAELVVNLRSARRCRSSSTAASSS